MHALSWNRNNIVVRMAWRLGTDKMQSDPALRVYLNLGTAMFLTDIDWERSKKRFEAFWERQIIDRPIVIAGAAMPDAPALPDPQGRTIEQRWLDPEYCVAVAEAHMARTYFAGDAFPAFFHNIGPGALAAFLGSEVSFSESTVWFHECVTDLERTPLPTLDPNNKYWRAVQETTRLACQRGQGKYINCFTDIGGVTDVLASMYGTQNLMMDMLERPDAVRPWLRHITGQWIKVYNELLSMILPQGGTRGWLSFWSAHRTYPLQNDYSCMISPEMFTDVCLEELQVLTGFLDQPFYHLDGPGAVKHVDALLALPRLRAIQWQPGASGGVATDWLDLLKKIQKGGKGILFDVRPYEFDTIMSELRPEGVIARVAGTTTPAEADDAVRRLSKWH